MRCKHHDTPLIKNLNTYASVLIVAFNFEANLNVLEDLFHKKKFNAPPDAQVFHIKKVSLQTYLISSHHFIGSSSIVPVSFVCQVLSIYLFLTP